jgi:hypothetical protein
LYRNEDNIKFREAISRAGTFYLAQGNNGAIFGALTFVNMTIIKPGWNYLGPGETLIFSVTNKKIYNYVLKDKPITVLSVDMSSEIMFGDGFEIILRGSDKVSLTDVD